MYESLGIYKKVAEWILTYLKYLPFPHHTALSPTKGKHPSDNERTIKNKAVKLFKKKTKICLGTCPEYYLCKITVLQFLKDVKC